MGIELGGYFCNYQQYMGPTSLCCPHHVRLAITLSNWYFLISPLLTCSSFSSFFFFLLNSPFSSFFLFSSNAYHHSYTSTLQSCSHLLIIATTHQRWAKRKDQDLGLILVCCLIWVWWLKMEFNLGLVFQKKNFLFLVLVFVSKWNLIWVWGF